MAATEHRAPTAVNVSIDRLSVVAGCQVSIDGRFWVSTEDRLAGSLRPGRARDHHGSPVGSQMGEREASAVTRVGFGQ
jgi:hypothetical protein